MHRVRVDVRALVDRHNKTGMSPAYLAKEVMEKHRVRNAGTPYGPIFWVPDGRGNVTFYQREGRKPGEEMSE